MIKNIEAIYSGGVLRPLEPLDLAENEKVTITICTPNTANQGGMPPQFATRDEWQDAISSWAASHAQTGTDADWSRESIYAGRGE
jgi:hypothetical protein